MNNKIVIGLMMLLMSASAVSLAQPEATEVSKAEFLKVTQYMMMEPCTVKGYMQCLGIENSVCQKAVHASFSSCDDKVPQKIDRSKIQTIISGYGKCMTSQITTRLKLTPGKLDKCEQVLRDNLVKPGAPTKAVK